MHRVLVELTERDYQLLRRAAEADFRALRAQAQTVLRDYLKHRFIEPMLRVVSKKAAP